MTHGLGVSTSRIVISPLRPDQLMHVQQTDIPGLLIIEPRVFPDTRGFFLETYSQRRYEEAGLDARFVQDNHSRSVAGTLRGLHYQIQHPQGKLCWVVTGEVFDVTVDLRRSSPTFGRWVGCRLSATNHRQLYVPAGCAHGFCVLSETADFMYKCTDYYSPQHERTLLWNDPQLAVQWPVDDPCISEKDRAGVRLAEAELYA